MRFQRLDLEKYGPFTASTLAFQPDAKLHLVFGANEAGKSCALAAITDLLFGFEHKIQFAFLHRPSDLRIGAQIRARDGAELAFRRRRGNKQTLIDASEAPLQDDVLTPFLGGLSRDIFCRAFGLGTADLRNGAEEMLRSEGEVGASLFAAASGLRGLNDLRRSLEHEADGIFASRASQSRTFYQALQRHESARRTMRERALGAAAWKDLNEQIAALAQRHAEIEERRRDKDEQLARLARLRRVAPQIRLIDEDSAVLRELDDLPEVATDFIQGLSGALAAATDAADAVTRAEQEHGSALAALGQVSVDAAALQWADDIVRLFGETGAYAGSRRDLPRVQSEARGFDDQLAQLALQLGHADAGTMASAQPTAAHQAVIRALATEGRACIAERRGAAETLTGDQDRLDDLERRRGQIGAARDPEPLRERLASLDPERRLLERRGDLEASITAETQSLNEAAARLHPVVRHLDALAETALPGSETIARFRKELDIGHVRLARLKEEYESTASAIAERRAELTELAAGPPVASPRAIAEMRTARDTQWQALRATLFGADASLSGTALIDGVGAFERYGAEADRLADRAAEDAGRSVHQSVAERDCERLENRKAALSEEIAAAQAQEHDVLSAWRDAWVATGIEPSTPEEMAAWLPAVIALLGRREQNEGRRHELAGTVAAEVRVRPELELLAGEVGLAVNPETAPMMLIGQIEQRLRALAMGWMTIRDLEARIGDAKARVERDVAAVQIAEAGRLAWIDRWSSAISAIRLPADAGIEVAEAVLEKWAQVPAILAERDNRAARVAGMSRDIADFEECASRIIGATAPDLADVPQDVAIKTLHARVTAAQTARSRRQELERRLSELETAVADARAAAEEASRKLAEYAVKLPPEVDLTEAISRLRRRGEVRMRLAERREQLLLHADGMTEDRLRDDLSTFDPDRASASMQQLEEEKERLHQEAQEVFAAHDRESRHRDELEQGVGAEGAAFDFESANADIAASAREWAVLKIGSLLVSRVIEQHRASQRDPLMVRAGELFSGLTGGAFAGISQAFDDADVPRLIGQRTSGEPLRIEEMSEGTRDQLYLALRLAYLEDYAGRVEAAPFVGDDLFTTFDDTRTAHGLKALAAIGASIQPILFTHHRHVVEIAHAELGPDADVLELG